MFDHNNFHEILKIALCLTKSNFIMLDLMSEMQCIKKSVKNVHRTISILQQTLYDIKYWHYYFNILIWNAHSSSFNRLFLRLAFCHKLWLVPSHKKILASLDLDRVWVSSRYGFFVTCPNQNFIIYGFFFEKFRRHNFLGPTLFLGRLEI